MNNILNNQRGVAIYLTFWVMSLLMGVAFGISAMLMTQIGIMRGIGESVLAFAATDAGIEHVLFLDTSIDLEPAPCEGDMENIGERVACLKSIIPLDSVSLSNGASYELIVEAAGEGGCPMVVNYCAKSTGSYKSARRAIRIAR